MDVSNVVVSNPKKSKASVAAKSTIDCMYNVPKDMLDLRTIETVRRDLIMIPRMPKFLPSKKQGSDAVMGFYAFGETDTHLSVPRFYGVEKWGLPPKENTNVFEGATIDFSLQFNGELRDDPPQKLAHKTIIEALCGKDGQQTFGGAMVQLPCGYGKTILAIAIAVHLRRRTMILVHKEFLMEQWIKRIQSFVPAAKIGKLQQNKIQIEGKDFIVGMVQSVSGRDYPRELLQSIGLLIVDESHHMAAQFFSKAIPKIPCKYVVGLSATPRRADGLQRLLQWSMGKIAFAVTRKVEKVAVAQIVYDQGQQKEIKTRGGDALKPQMLNALVTERPRNAVLLEILVKLMSYNKSGKRKVIVLSDRLEHLDLLMGSAKIALGAQNYSYGKYIGGMTEQQRDQSAECDMIFGTFSMASEALDIPALDTLVLASPKYDVEQAVGRILRPCYGKMTPLVIDIVDPFSYFLNYGWSRHKFYEKHKYNLTRQSHLTFLPKFDDWLKLVDSNKKTKGMDSDKMDVDGDEDDQSDEPEGWLDE